MIVSTGIPIVGLGAPTPTPTPTARGRTSADLQSTAIATAFYPFARLSLSETRRQVEASAEFQEKQALRREERKDVEDHEVDRQRPLTTDTFTPSAAISAGDDLLAVPDTGVEPGDAAERPAPVDAEVMPTDDAPAGGRLDVVI